MKFTKIIAKVLGLLGIILAVGTVYVSLNALNAPPIMIRQPKGAVDCAELLMHTICDGDFEKAGKLLYGSPSLGSAPEKGENPEGMIWDAFISTISYEFPGECYASGSGVTLDVQVRSLDISSVTDSLTVRAQTLLNERVAKAVDVKEIYDENNNYREDFVAAILRDATADALKEDAKLREKTITLHLVYENGQWWVVPTAALLDLISGSVSG